jgi:uncharacterized protein involved in tellurium resistance
MITDPRFAPRRDDLPYLRRRTRTRVAAVPPESPTPPQPAPATTPATGVRYVHEPKAKPAAPATPPTASGGVQYVHPTRAAHPDAPAAAPAPTQSPAPVSSSLDLDAPRVAPPAGGPPAAGPGPASTSLDLDPTPAPAPVAPTGATSTARPSVTEPLRRVHDDVRIAAGGRLILTPTAPTVTLTRVQSGIGTLSIEAACGPDVGDLRLGAAYQLGSGVASTVQMTQGERFAPPHSRRPVIVSGRDRFEQLRIDLRQAGEVRRLIVYAFSANRAPLSWSGTLIVTTFGGGRLEVPMESLQGGQVAVLLSLYNVRGEFVLRAEMQALNGDVREAARAYGYDQIAWVDDRTPVE